MPRVRRPAAPTSAATLLALMWLASPALPVGGFSYSEGLEAAAEAGLVRDEATAREWLLDQLVLGLGRGELAVVGRALAAWRRRDAARVRELNDWLLATRESAEMRLQTEQMGRSLAAWLQQRPDTDAAALAALSALPPAPSYPVAFALAAAGTQASAREAALAFAFGWAENMVQAAIKAVPLGQSAGQRILGALGEAIPETADAALALQDSERMAFTPMLAVLSARHETQYSRLFRS
ncbi:urease accessory protein UreF [Methylibium sp.]|uniref:urease accessory protein UreF n=1 Tax=Methylibium sp. TaxID=2067992 RepID=UPI003D0AFBD9